MAENSAPITGKDTIARWLEHPAGNAAITQLLAGMGQGEEALAQVRNLPLNTLVQMSQGALTQEAVDALVLRANGGVMPEEAPAAVATRRFESKTIIVTGAASGIGRATAERILAEGGRVIAVDISADALAAFAAAHGEAVVPVSGNIVDDEDIAKIVEAAGESVDGLANIAGIMDGMQPLHEVENDMWERVMGVNVTGTFKLSRAVLPGMLARGAGTIVNITSEAGLRGNAAGAAYTASKHAVIGLTKSSAFMYGPSGIRTNAVAPGPTATAIGGDFRSELGKERIMPFMALIPPVTTAENLAASITWLLSDDSVNINGQIIASDAGWSVQ